MEFSVKNGSLHSTMFKLLYQRSTCEFFELASLHSTMFKLLSLIDFWAAYPLKLYIPLCLNYYCICANGYSDWHTLHSTMFKLLYYIYFTFYTDQGLHSTMFKLLFVGNKLSRYNMYVYIPLCLNYYPLRNRFSTSNKSLHSTMFKLLFIFNVIYIRARGRLHSTMFKLLSKCSTLHLSYMMRLHSTMFKLL